MKCVGTCTSRKADRPACHTPLPGIIVGGVNADLLESIDRRGISQIATVVLVDCSAVKSVIVVMLTDAGYDDRLTVSTG